MTQIFLFRFEEGGKYEHDGDHYDGYHLRLYRDYLRDNEQRRQGMKFKGDINGVISDSETMTFKPSKLYVQYTSDKIGKSLSIGN